MRKPKKEFEAASKEFEIASKEFEAASKELEAASQEFGAASKEFEATSKQVKAAWGGLRHSQILLRQLRKHLGLFHHLFNRPATNARD